MTRTIPGPRPSGAFRFASCVQIGCPADLSNPRHFVTAAPHPAFPAGIKKPALGGLFNTWRRGWDSNPRRAINPCWFSRPVHSTALPPLLKLIFSYPLPGGIIPGILPSTPAGPRFARSNPLPADLLNLTLRFKSLVYQPVSRIPAAQAPWRLVGVRGFEPPTPTSRT